MVLARGKREGTLNIIARSGDVISVVESYNESNLWHCTLGHMSEKMMKVL